MSTFQFNLCHILKLGNSQVIYMFQDLEVQCEHLMKEEFNEICKFDVEDAVQKLEKLRIVEKVSLSL